MKKLFLFLFLAPALANAQSRLIAQGSGNDLYLDHTTAPKENYYSIGRMYNISPKEIAPYNKLVLDKGLALNQKIKVPLHANFTQSAGDNAGEVAVPVYHKAATKETLKQISGRYNKVPVASLKAWNKMSGYAVPAGTDVVIGYLLVKPDLSSLAAGASANISGAPQTAPIAVTKPVPAAPVVAVKETPIAKTETPIAKTETVVPQNEVPAVMPATPVSGKDYSGGAFRSAYSAVGRTSGGNAGIFKSTSGWQDGKYYCLFDGAPRGTVVKITDDATGKVVYAKVLDTMPDLKQNNDLAIRLSNSAADALGAADDNFPCKIEY